MKTYMSKYITDGSSYKKRVLLPVVCVGAMLIIFAAALGLVIASSGGLKTAQIQWLITILLLLIAAGSTVLMLRVGINAYRDALVFCLTKDGSLYVIDASNKPSQRASWGLKTRLVFNFFKSLSETARILDRIARDGIPEEDLRTGKIKQINKLQYVSGRRYAECSIETGDGSLGTWRYDISNHTEELFGLLESRSASGIWETGGNTYTKQICLSALLLLLCLGLCIASHPSVGCLPAAMYFPSLFILYIPAILLGIFILKKRRGE